MNLLLDGKPVQVRASAIQKSAVLRSLYAEDAGAPIPMPLSSTAFDTWMRGPHNDTSVEDVVRAAEVRSADVRSSAVASSSDLGLLCPSSSATCTLLRKASSMPYTHLHIVAAAQTPSTASTSCSIAILATVLGLSVLTSPRCATGSSCRRRVVLMHRDPVWLCRWRTSWKLQRQT